MASFKSVAVAAALRRTHFDLLRRSQDGIVGVAVVSSALEVRHRAASPSRAQFGAAAMPIALDVLTHLPLFKRHQVKLQIKGEGGGKVGLGRGVLE